MKTATVIGGGTGSFIVLSGLKKYDINLGVIVSMMDSGGSTGRLRDQLGVLPPGDLRQCLVALSDKSYLWRKLFLYRFQKGDLKGHNFGNIFLSTLEKVTTNYEEVIKIAAFVLKLKGPVIPVTFHKTNLCAKYESGKIIKGEGKIDENIKEASRIKCAFLSPLVLANKRAVKRIKKTDYLIVGPGDLYTSIIPVLLVKGIKKAIMSSKLKIIYIMNLMTKTGQTTGYTALDHVKDLTLYLGRKPDFIIINNGQIKKSILNWYSKNNEKPVKDNINDDDFKGKIIRSDLVDSNIFKKPKADKLIRSILRHDSKKLAKDIFNLIK